MNTNQPIHLIAQESVDKSAILAVSFSFLLVMLPHFFHIPPWVIGFTVFALVWRSTQAFELIGAIPRWILVPLVLVGGLGVFA